MAEELPPQEELRRRLRAGRVLRDLTVQQLCDRIPNASGMGERTMRKLESGESQLKPPALRELAAALELPYSWFTVPSIADALGFFDPPDKGFAERLAALERFVAEFRPGEEGNPESPLQSGLRRSPRSTRRVGEQ